MSNIVHAEAVAVPMGKHSNQNMYDNSSNQGYGHTDQQHQQNGDYNYANESQSQGGGNASGGMTMDQMAEQLQQMQMEQNVYDMESTNQGQGNEGNWADDTIERSGNLFNQLDSMIAAVQTESSALDKMREKLRELDGMRVQLSSLTKKLLDADHANLALKSNLVKIQEAYAEARRHKQELESTLVPLRQDLNKHKDLYNRERNARLSAQQESTMLKDQLVRLEKVNEEMERDVKAIPTLQEQNELLRTDLNRLRQRYKEENEYLTTQNQQLAGQLRAGEEARNEMRNLAVRMLDLSSQGHGNTNAHTQQQGAGPRRAAPHLNAIQWEQQQMQMQQQHQQMQMQQPQPQPQPQPQQIQSMQPQAQPGYVDVNNLPQTAQPQALQNANAVNDGRGGAYDGAQWTQQTTLEEHMLGGSAQRNSGITPQKYPSDTRSLHSLASQSSPQNSVGAGSQVSLLSMHSPSMKYSSSEVMMASPGKTSDLK
jgi:hypothetical protein